MKETVTISVKIPKETYEEIVLRWPEGERSSIIRDAIIEKLQKTPRPDRILELEKKLGKIEEDIAIIKKTLAELEVLTYEKGKINPHAFCIDRIDHALIDYLIHYNGATTPELAEAMKLNRWLILNRLKKIMYRSKKELGKPVIEYFGGEKAGKRKAWWLNEELT